MIDAGSDLRRWNDPKDRDKRRLVLGKLAETLRSPAPPAKRVTRPFKANNQWEVGEVVAYRLASGRWTAFRVIGHHTDKGGRSAVCEPLEWTGSALPQHGALRLVKLRRPVGSWGITQFLLGEPRRKQDAERLARTGVVSKPHQHVAGFAVFVFPHFDRQLREVFGLE
jgi:hypothetical protein